MSEKSLLGDAFFDGYKVTEKIGAGAFGTVYKVEKRDASGGYIRALKHITIPSSKQQYDSVFNSMGGDVSKVDDYFSAMLSGIVSEIQILNDLSEKGVTNIVRYYAHNIVTSESPKQYDIYILMEYLTPLTDYLSSKSFTVRDVAAFGLDVLKALELCHGNGIIHRDIKDDNVFVAANGEYKIGDFGVSKVLKGSTKAESVKGTPNFIAPEVYLNKEGYTQSVDLYSLGIVLYRLLNYNRNPFLPAFPLPYEPEDEDAAFNERMKGSVPNLPVMGENAIGNVIVKATSGKTERFSSASEFCAELQKAINDTADSVLNATINVVSNSKEENQQTYSDSNKKVFEATIKETVGAAKTFSSEPQDTTSETNKHLFETVGEVYNPPVPDATSKITDEPKTKDKKTPKAETTQFDDIPAVPAISPMDEPAPIDRNITKGIVYVLPIVLALIGIIAYFVIIPNIYGRIVSFIEWLFTNPQNIIDTLKDPNAVLPKAHTIIGIKVFWYVWLAGFIASLFFVGKRLQRKPEPNATNAIMTKKEPYLAIQEISGALKAVKQRSSAKEIDALIKTVKILEEKLSVESDFGYGKESVIACENNIARQLQFISSIMPSIESGDFSEITGKINAAMLNISNLLRRRIELKKR